MSAANLISSNDAVHLLADGALYDRRGIIRSIGSKIHVRPDLRMAFGWAGWGNHNVTVGRALAKVGDPEIALAMMPGLLRKACGSNRRQLGYDEPTRFLIACWGKDGAQAWVVTSGGHACGLEPFKLTRVRNWIDMDPALVAETLGRDIKRCGDGFDPWRDGLRLIEAQRKHPFEDGSYAVGGFAEIASVTSEGVKRRTLIEWPDAIGFPIDLTATTRPNVIARLGGHLRTLGWLANGAAGRAS